jgi:hypothetical protein
MGMSVRDVMRVKGTPYHELKLDDPAITDDQLLDAMMAHPILINRPIVVAPLGVKLCRPSETVLDLLPAAWRVSQGGRRAGGRQRRPSRVLSMIPKSGTRFLEKIMRKHMATTG